MGIQLRLPDIKGTDAEQLRQLRSYLYQIVPQLQWALDQSFRQDEKSAEIPKQPPEIISSGFRVSGASANARASAWTELGLSEEVSLPEKIFGRGGEGCRYTIRGGRTSVAFCCSVPSALPVKVSAAPLPTEYRPPAPVRALCPAEFADGNHGIACAEIAADGYARIIWAKGSDGTEKLTAVDGIVDF